MDAAEQARIEQEAGVSAPPPSKPATVTADTIAPEDTIGLLVKKRPRVDPVPDLYLKAKSMYVAMQGEPRHAALEGTFVELGLAIRAFELEYESELGELGEAA